MAVLLRRIALHQETAAVLELRAERAGSAATAELLRRRAVERRAIAQRLRRQLAAGDAPRNAKPVTGEAWS